MEFKFAIGDPVKDQLTGFKGVVTARVEFITGCNQYYVNPRRLTKDGDTITGSYYDENRLTLIKGSPRFGLAGIKGPSRNPARGGPAGTMEPPGK